MKFVADEGVDYSIVDVLRRDGHIVWYVAEIAPGLSDSDILKLAMNENAILLTNDKDFGDLVFRQRRLSHGIVLIRLFGLTPDRKANMVSILVKNHGQEMVNSFSVITPQKIRIRPHIV